MRLDAMLGKSTCGVEKKIKEPTKEEAKKNIETQEKIKGMRPYPISAASLMKNEETDTCRAVLLPTGYGQEDSCSLCTHEHENWGNNQHCRACSSRYML